MKQRIIYLFFIILLTSIVAAAPGIPHQFYGSVYVNGNPAPENNIIVAAVEGSYYTTVTLSNGLYGVKPNIFYAADPDGDKAGKTISLYLGGRVINGVYDFRGVPVGSVTFANNGYTELDISTTTTCGDGYCIGSETCSSCNVDCGICINSPIITINSPENKIYDTNKINLNVSSDQYILIWWYSLNNGEFIQFNPNILMTAEQGENTLIVKGINQFIQPGTSSVSFTVELPSEYCGDAICNNGEDCNSCSSDCGVCPPPSSSSGSGGGSGGGSITKKTNLTTLATSSQSNNNTNLSVSIKEENENTEENNQGTQETGALSGITGAVIGFAKTKTGIGIGIALIIIISGIAVLTIQKKNKQQDQSES